MMKTNNNMNTNLIIQLVKGRCLTDNILPIYHNWKDYTH